jgi:hypothetical protein
MPKILRWHRLSQRQSKCGVAAEIRIRFMVNLPKHGLRTCIAPRVNGSNIFVEIVRPEKDRSASLMPADGTRVICPHADFGTSRRDVQFYPAAYSRKAISCSVTVRGMTG